MRGQVSFQKEVESEVILVQEPSFIIIHVPEATVENWHELALGVNQGGEWVPL